MEKEMLKRYHALSFDRKTLRNLILPLAVLLVLFFFICCARTYFLKSVEEQEKQTRYEVAESISNTVTRYTRILESLASSQNVLHFAQMKDTSVYSASVFAQSINSEMSQVASVSSLNLGRHQLAIFFTNLSFVITPSQYYVNSDYSALFSNWYGDNLTQAMMDEKNLWDTYCADGRSWLVRRIFIDEVLAAYIILEFNLPEMSAEWGNYPVFIGNNTEIIYTNHPDFNNDDYLQVLKELEHGRRITLSGRTYSMVKNAYSSVALNILVGVPSHLAGWQLFANFTLFAAFLTLTLVFYFFFLKKKAVEPAVSEPGAFSGPVQEDFTHNLEQMLFSLLSANDVQAKELSRQCLDIAGINADGELFVMGFSCLEDTLGLFSISNDDPRSAEHVSFYFVLNNMLQDLIFNIRPGVLCYINNSYVALIERSGSETPKDIEITISQLRESAMEYLGMKLVVTEPILTGADTLRNSVSATIREISHRSFWRIAEESQNLQPTTDRSTVFFRLMGNLRRSTESENYSEALSILDTIIDKHLPMDPKHLNIAKNRVSLIADMLSAVTGYSFDKLNAELLTIDNIQGYRTAFRQIFDELISRHTNESTNPVPDSRVEKVREYINDHYGQSDLNVTRIAEHFELNATYLSRIFKESTGMTLLDYIQRVRVEAAKGLLKTNSVKDTLAMVGFWDMQAFVRAFRKFEGMTPAQYKKIGSYPEN